jgi:hypothetical protein
MPTCQCDGIESRFDEPYAAEKLALYRDSGPDLSTTALIDALREEDLTGRTLLDIGGGVGAIQHELLRSGVASVQEVEASVAYLAACKAEAKRQGHADRITHLSGDLASVAADVQPADIVTLDRSLCCWADMPDLVSRSAALAKWRYGLVYPRDALWVRYGWRLYSNLRKAASRNAMRVLAHRRAEVESILADHGLRRHSYAEVGVWQIAVYAKDSS